MKDIKGEALIGVVLISGIIGAMLGISFKETSDNGAFRSNMKKIWCKMQAKESCE